MMKNFKNILSSILLSVVMLNASVTTANDTLMIRPLDSLPYDWGKVVELKVIDEFVYLADENFGLRIIDVSNPSRPNQVGSFRTPGAPSVIDIENNRVYLGGSGIGGWSNNWDFQISGFYVIDVQDLANPHEDIFCPVNNITSLEAIGGTLYVGCHRNRLEDSTLYAFDITNPENLWLLATASRFNVLDLIAVNDFLCVIHQGGLATYHFDNPWNLRLSRFSPIGSSYDIGAISGLRAYMAGYNSRFVILDLFSVDPFPLIGQYMNLPSRRFNCIGPWGDRVIVCGDSVGEYGWNRILDVSDPENISEIGDLPTTDRLEDIEIVDDIAFTAANYGGLKIFDLNDLNAIDILGALCNPGYVNDVAISDHYAYLANGGCMPIVDISNPEDIREVAIFEDIDASSLLIRDTLMIVEGNGVSLFSIADPLSPRRISTIRNGDNFPPSLWGDRVVVGSGDFTYIYSISRIERPALISTIPARSVNSILSGDLLYLAGGELGLTVWDVSHPGSPRLTTQYRNNYAVNALELIDTLLVTGWGYYYGGGPGAIQIFNTSNPGNLREIGYLRLEADVAEIERKDSLLFLGSESEEMAVVNISNPAEPSLVGGYEIEGNVASLEVVEDIIFTASYDKLGVYEFSFEPNSVENKDPLPKEFMLSQPFPNPFNSITTIRYSLPETSSIKLSVFDLSGRGIATLASGNRIAGVHNAVWNAEGVGSGLYFVRLEAGAKTMTQKVMLVK